MMEKETLMAVSVYNLVRAVMCLGPTRRPESLQNARKLSGIALKGAPR